MASGNTIIIGGGIAGASPFTIGQFPVIVLTDPKTVTDGNIRQDTSAPPKVFIGQSTYSTTCTVIGGAIANANAGASIVIGNSASSLPSGVMTRPSVVIGSAAASSVSGTGGNVIIGASSTVTGATSDDAVVVGAGIIVTAGRSTVVIGADAANSVGNQQVVIGATARCAANNLNVVIGFAAAVSGGAGVASCVVVGPNSGTNKTGNVLIGTGVIDNNTTGDNVFIGKGFASLVGDPGNSVGFFNNTGFTTFCIGRSFLNAFADSLLFRLTNGTGANIAAGNLTIQPGISTGNATPGIVQIQTGAVGGAGSTLQTTRIGFAVGASLVARDTDISVWDQDGLALKRVSVGAADSGGVGFKLLRIAN